MSRALLVASLGASWQVVPEAVGLVAPRTLDLYANHTDVSMRTLASRWADRGLLELWIVTTASPESAVCVGSLQDWRRRLGAPFPLRIWQARAQDVTSDGEAREIRELTYRVVLAAVEKSDANGGSVVLSLAGGRKTMSADVHAAGALFGAEALVHVLAREKAPPWLTAVDLSRPLSAETAGAFVPVVVGRGRRHDLVDVSVRGRPRIEASLFPLPPAPEDGTAATFDWPLGSPSLVGEIEYREGHATELLGAYVRQLLEEEKHESFRSLYRLPPRRIEQLRKTVVSEMHRPLLGRFPKADLHRHLGGCLDLPAQRRVAHAVWDALEESERAEASERVRPLLTQEEPFDTGLREALGVPRAGAAAALLRELSDDDLAHRLWGRRPGRAIGTGRDRFPWYELPGELSGSALLEHGAAVEPYAREVYSAAVAEGLSYLELRCSPSKYLRGDGQRFLERFREGLRMAGGLNPACEIRLILTIDRRRHDDAPGIATLAAQWHDDSHGNLVVGVDLAGDESYPLDVEALRRDLQPAFECGLHVTIHAGEGQPPERIWEAAYHLQADRVGHGLTLAGAPSLAQRFRDRRICVEMCPTSNLEVVGYREAGLPESAGREEYPLRTLFLDLGVPVAVCTDNPGISRTDTAGELVQASRLSEGLSLWEVLALVKRGFLHAFLPAEGRERLLKDADARIFELISEGDLD